jgi:uncharacterized protein YjdB
MALAAGTYTAVVTVSSLTYPSISANFTVSFTVYSMEPQGISVSFSDSGSGAFSETGFSVKQNGTPSSQTVNLTGTWTSQEWRVDGTARGTGTNITVNAAHYAVGNHTLQVTVKDGAGKYWSKTLQFTVTAGVTGISLNKNTLALPVTGTETLFALLTPANAANKNVIWSSTNVSVATVSNGTVTAIGVGSAVITAKSEDDPTLSATCTVTVTAGATGTIILSFNDPGAGAFSQATFTLNATLPSQLVSLTGTWVSQEWRVDGVIRGTGMNITVNAADYGTGNHTLQVTVKDGAGKYWSKTLQFTKE